MAKCLGKVNVTSAFESSDWDGVELTDLFIDPNKVEIISAVVVDGSLYLIYVYDTNDFIE